MKKTYRFKRELVMTYSTQKTYFKRDLESEEAVREACSCCIVTAIR